MASEINELKRILEEKEALNGQMTRSKNSMQKSNEEIDVQTLAQTRARDMLRNITCSSLTGCFSVDFLICSEY